MSQWTLEKTNFLQQQCNNMSLKEIAHHIDISYNVVREKAKQLNLPVRTFKRNDYSAQELQIVKEHFEWAPKQFIMDLLPNRDWRSILSKGYHMNLHRMSQDKISLNYRFFNEWTEQSAYVFGFILADGYIHKGQDQNVLQIEVAPHDSDVIEKIATALEFKGKLYKRNAGVKFQTHNLMIINDLASKGIPLKDKSHTAIWPSGIPEKFERHVIRGLIDGDGWSRIDADGNYNLGMCGTYELVSAVKDKLNYDCSDNKVRLQGPGCYRFNIKGYKAIKIAEWVYGNCDLYLQRKYDVYQEASQKTFLRLRRDLKRTRGETQ